MDSILDSIIYNPLSFDNNIMEPRDRGTVITVSSLVSQVESTILPPYQ
jgi:hypothetical protein